jgi:hypothetical protein
MTDSVALQTTRGVRCSDADRERTSARLRDVAGEGYLTMDELEERLTRVYAARYGHELDVLVLDLPRAKTFGAGAFSPTAGWGAVLAMILTQFRLDLALLFGRQGSGWTRRRVIVALVAVVVVVGVIGFAVGGFGFEHEGFGHEGVDHGGFEGRD